MKSRKILLLVMVLVSLGITVRAQGKVHDFSLKDIDNHFVNYFDLRGDELTVIDFWATWCQPCIRSLPKLVELNREYKDRGVRFIGISVDSPRNHSKVKPFTRSMGIDYPVLLDSNGEVMGELSIMAVPTLLIVNRDNEILYTHEGFNAGDEEEIRDVINEHLAE